MKRVVGCLGEKLKMTQIVSESGANKGKLIAVTILAVKGNVVSQIRTKEKEGYNSCQIAFRECPEKGLNKPKLRHLLKKEISPRKHLVEIRDMEALPLNSPVSASSFKVGERLKISGLSKGHGTEGPIRRHGLKIGPKSHGAGYPHRYQGSICSGRGSGQKVFKGKTMAGRMGNERFTMMSRIEKIDENNDLIFIRGAVVGPRRGLVVLRQFLFDPR